MDIKELLLVFFYAQVKKMAEGFIGNLGIPVDYVLLALGYWKRDTWWGRGLIYGAVASLGATIGAQILQVPGTQAGTQSKTAEKPAEALLR